MLIGGAACFRVQTPEASLPRRPVPSPRLLVLSHISKRWSSHAKSFPWHASRHAILKAAYTPRTKARKRLRGEEVPPTPARAAKRASRGKSGAAFGAQLAGVEEEKLGAGAATMGGAGAWGRKAQLGQMDEADEDMNRVSLFKPAATTEAGSLPKSVLLLPCPSGWWRRLGRVRVTSRRRRCNVSSKSFCVAWVIVSGCGRRR